MKHTLVQFTDFWGLPTSVINNQHDNKGNENKDKLQSTSEALNISVQLLMLVKNTLSRYGTHTLTPRQFRISRATGSKTMKTGT
jgi:hypothetical protein